MNNSTEVHLKVEDAVTYLEQVKDRYRQRPQTYNDFLEIMKDFKSQTIDTPGVIDRVANLFEGDPEMIMGFNMFLPPEYRVEVHYTSDPYAAGSYAGLATSSHSSGSNYTVKTVHNSALAEPLGIGEGTTTGPVNFPVQDRRSGNHGQPSGDQLFKQPFLPPSLSNSKMSTDGRLGPRFSLPSNFPSAPNRLPVSSPFPVGYVGMSAYNYNMYAPQATVPTPPTTPWSNVNGGMVNGYPINLAWGSPGSGSSVENGPLTASPTSRLPLASASASSMVTPPPGAPPSPLISFFPSPSVGNDQIPNDFYFACSYVNKVKSAFESKPGKYQEFMSLILSYQHLKAPLHPSATGLAGSPGKTVDQLFKEAKKLFKGRNDLLAEFRFYIDEHMPTSLPQTKTGKGIKTVTPVKKMKQPSSTDNQNQGQPKKRTYKRKQSNPKSINTSIPATQTSLVSSSSSSPGPKPIECIPKRPVFQIHPRSTEVTTTAVSSSSSSSCKINGNADESESGEGEKVDDHTKKKMTEPEFFENVRKFLNPSSEAYDNFLLLISYYSQQIMPGPDCLQLATPILAPAPELLHWFKKYIRRWEKAKHPTESASTKKKQAESEETFLDIDYAACKRSGASYCIIPSQNQPGSQSSFIHPNDPLSVLNEVYVSIPHWSDNIRYVAPRRTQLETCQNRIEDERFELDMVIESNLQTIENLQLVERKMSLMSPKERENFTLDECLGGTSSTINERSVRRLYGNSEKADEVIEGLKKCPGVAVPIVLRRLQSKDLEWNKRLKEFQKIWRDELDALQIKALDSKANQFKQTDLKSFRLKTLLSEIESVYNKREKAKKNGTQAELTELAECFHLSLRYGSRSFFVDASELVLHSVRRMSLLQLEDMKKIKQIFKLFIPDLFAHPHVDDGEETESLPTSQSSQSKLLVGLTNGMGVKNRRTFKRIKLANVNSNTASSCHTEYPENKDKNYRLFFGNAIWYGFFRLHHILCERLSQIYDLGGSNLTEDDMLGGTVTGQLGYKPEPIVDQEKCYLTFTQLLKNLIDCEIDNNEYEDRLRNLFGTQAYIAFTMDKMIEAALGQLLSLRDENWQPFLNLYYQHNENGLLFKEEEELEYQQEVKTLVSGRNSIFKVVVFDNKPEMKVKLIPLSPHSELGQNKRCNDRKKPEFYKFDEAVPSTNRRIVLFQYYRKGAFSRARMVHKAKTLVKLEKFNRWHSHWLRSNTTEEDQKNCNDWLVEPPPCRNDDDDNDGILFLSVLPCNRVEETPYRLFKRYLISGPRRQ
ncbi:Paired amphipathic helix protein Sin3a [Orchesella cincta]|uniref:Paired amphipathic helix protein Sin3a n=1 Tax=Orchesella cincta TaxID=48709 RepID=A0A1D2ML95_ORCCI|nr:Paired amphipathic helix protein Sin3a [Orchesella cincta]